MFGEVSKQNSSSFKHQFQNTIRSIGAMYSKSDSHSSNTGTSDISRRFSISPNRSDLVTLSTPGFTSKFKAVNDRVSDAVKHFKEYDQGDITLDNLTQLSSDIGAAIDEITAADSGAENSTLQMISSELTDHQTTIDAMAAPSMPSITATDGQLTTLLDDTETVMTDLAAAIQPYTESTGGGEAPASNPLPDTVFEYDTSATNFSGTSDAVIVDHDDDMLLDNGSISIDFNADSVSGRRTLYSKDSSNYDTGGHLTIYVESGEAVVRLQSDDATYEVRGGDIDAGEDQNITFSFGDDGMKLFVDGEIVSSNAYTGGLGTTSGGTGNFEQAAIGANTWASSNLVANNLRDAFDGTIGSVKIYNEGLSNAQVAEAHGVEPATDFNAIDVATEFAESGNVHYQLDQTYDGSNDYTNINHQSAMELDNGSIEVRFTADDTSGSQGLFSSDSSGYDDGGHFTLYMSGDDIIARIQSTTSTYELRANNIVTAGQEHDVVVSFGDNGFELYVDGELEDSDGYTGGLGTTSGGSGNENPIAIGANAWGSGNNSNSGLTHYFEGSISDVVIHNTQLDASTIDARAGADIRPAAEEEGGEILSTTSANRAYNDVQAILTAIDDTDETKQDRAQETYHRLSNLLGEIDKANPADDGYTILSDSRDDIVARMDALEAYVSTDLQSLNQHKEGLQAIESDLGRLKEVLLGMEHTQNSSNILETDRSSAVNVLTRTAVSGAGGVGTADWTSRGSRESISSIAKNVVSSLQMSTSSQLLKNTFKRGDEANTRSGPDQKDSSTSLTGNGTSHREQTAGITENKHASIGYDRTGKSKRSSLLKRGGSI